MQINEQDFYSFLTVKEGLDKNSVKQCMSRIRIINQWLEGREISKELVESFFVFLMNIRQLKNNSLNTYRFAFRHLVAYSKDRHMKR